MLPLKYLVLSMGVAMFVIALALLACDVCRLLAWRKNIHSSRDSDVPVEAPANRWRTTIALAMLAWAPVLISAGIVIVAGGAPTVHQSWKK